MTESIHLRPIAGRSVRMMVGNTPVQGRVITLSGLALKLSVTQNIPPVPRVRVELEDAEPAIASLQLQGMVTERAGGEVTITLERLMLAAGQEHVNAVLSAWFTAVPQQEDCYQPMMRGFGYELRKAILSGRGSEPASPAPGVSPAIPPHDPSNDTLPGIPIAAARAALEPEIAAALSVAPTPAAPLETPAPPSAPAVRPAAFEPPPAFRGTLPPQVARTAQRLLTDTTSLALFLDCSADGAGYGRAVVYRLGTGYRLAFVAARGVRPTFGARVELITDIVQAGVPSTGRVATSVVWVSPDPDVTDVTLMAVRLAPTNQFDALRVWDMACQLAQQKVAEPGPVVVLPTRALLSGLLNS